jgi:glutamate N-acetyltransferase / amino-acid N-acetyltransferase
MRPSRQFKQIPGSICAPRGFRCASVFCDIKRIGTGKGSDKGRKDDLALIVSDVPSAVAGMFTSNQVCAAPVKVSAKRVKNLARAIVVNSGNANACTGRQGMRDAESMTRLAAQAVAALGAYPEQGRGKRRNQKESAVLSASLKAGSDGRYRRISARDVLVCSTGRIGIAMPMKNVERGIRACAPLLARSARNARQVAEAIMTSDTRRKEIAVEFNIDNRTAHIGGICKGAGMIQPGMRSPVTAPAWPGKPLRHATMLCFLTTDASVSPIVLRQCLNDAVSKSFNRITVDGDTSTNDSVIMLANGLAGNSELGARNSPFELFQAALNHVCLELAKMIVRDGEGVSRFVTLRVRGARNAGDAEAAARAIANSSLVKTSWCGGDPNWGRVLCALGYSKAKVNESIVDVGYAEPGSREIVLGFRRGKPTNISLRKLAKITSAPEFEVHVDLHSGRGEFVMYASDLTEDYVAFNKGDVSDPASLGG